MRLVALLAAAAVVVKFWPVIVAVVGIVCAVAWGRLAADRRAERAKAQRRRLAELAARADQQHQWVIQGEDRAFGLNIRLPQC